MKTVYITFSTMVKVNVPDSWTHGDVVQAWKDAEPEVGIVGCTSGCSLGAELANLEPVTAEEGIIVFEGPSEK
jgi:hypothetical protein